MTSFKTLAVAALFALTAGSAMAAAVGGGGGAAGGEAGGVAGHDPSIAAIQLPSPPQAAPQTQPGQGTNCRYEFFRGHFCDVAPRR
ncbi:hypothetical protein [Phreatobacter oligotrophus]|jgi:hypothetical protein|uniref:Uncharacterized protein n=1 Tax=Phreatobacter oligotrophus TaxID=1122261 RepID=A0A2T4ZHE7_9HYPH|nr:hypothetical protein [Phreatobacter oligotrophus]PTM61409.1 hypothetical protein C8P69_10176 [Phreatobacter oligotrophus]